MMDDCICVPNLECPEHGRIIVDLTKLSYDAAAAVMNALNPGLAPFDCEADYQAFSNASLVVARNWSARRASR